MPSARLAHPARPEAKTAPPPRAVRARKSRRCMVDSGGGCGAGRERRRNAGDTRSTRSCDAIPEAAAVYSMPLLLAGRARLLQVGDQVGAVLRIGHVDAHALARRELLGVGEPALERGFVPDKVR